MTARGSAFKAKDVTRAVKAVRQAGETPASIVLTPTGEIVIELNAHHFTDAQKRRQNDFDED